MKYALITAPNGFHLLQEFNLGYHMVLAQKCLEDPKYKEFYRELARRGHFIILDNGAAEMQHSIDFDRVLSVADDIHADEVVMPDAMGDFDETCELFVTHRNEVPLNARMGVPQGDDWEEWAQCLHLMVLEGVSTIGIAKRYEAFEGGRLEAIRIAMLIQDQHPFALHMLGCYRNPIKEATEVRDAFPWVRGIDTAAPIAHAQQHLNMRGREAESFGHIPYEWGDEFSDSFARANVREMIDACISF